ncbi:MAG: hypothetical protein GY757_52695, partial [bacterium]|nr:hypothetical protein [bacterium]
MKFGINRTFILVTIIILLFLPAKGEKNKIKMPEIFPVQDKENPELYFSGVEIINYSFIKYKDAILDLLKDTTFRNWGEIRALFEDKNSIEKETITRHRCENGEPVHLPLHLNGKKNTPPNKLHNGLYAFKINRLVAQNKSNDLKLKNMVENITGRIKLFHKKEIDFVVRAGHKKILVWVYNNKTQKGIPNANVFLLRKKRATKFTKATTSTKATKSTTSTKSTMST